MLKFLIAALGIGLILGAGGPDAHGQQATEIYIPIGRSPGLSGKITFIGRIETVSPGDRSFSVIGPSGTASAVVTSRTKIWLDRSELRLSNTTGAFADLRTGLTVEIKYEGSERKSQGAAEWIKVRVEASS